MLIIFISSLILKLVCDFCPSFIASCCPLVLHIVLFLATFANRNFKLRLSPDFEPKSLNLSQLLIRIKSESKIIQLIISLLCSFCDLL